MQSLVRQVQTEGLFPVNPGTHGLCRLPVAEVFSKLHHTDQRELPRMESWLSFAGIDGAKERIVEERAQFSAHPQVHIPGGKRCVRDTGSLSRNRL
jgi:hypothetical protein